jgi:hypothetical protein
MKQVKEYMESCSLVGVKYIAEEGRHWTERVLWIILVFLRYTKSCRITEVDMHDYVAIE